jgi:hypothetical protein
MAKQTRRYILDYDASQEPPAGTDASAEIFSGLIDLHKKGARILEKKNPFTYPSSDIIAVKQGTIIALFNGLWRTFEVHQDIELNAGDIDAGGSFQVGTDYYVYLVDDGAGGQLVISANSTFPDGAAADNSRKLGGFHYGHIRCVNSRYAPVDSNGVVYGATGTVWQNNVTIGIVPNSVWDLKNRPNCSPEGMVLIGNRWADIYKASVAETVTFETGSNGMAFVGNGLLQSKYGQIPATGTEGLNWYSFQELAARSGKRLQTYGEFIQGAAGNPGGQDAADDYGWTKTSNGARARTGCRVNPSTGLYDSASGIKPYAISAHNLVDAIGNVWEWADECTVRQDTTSWAWQNVLGADKGQAYLPNNTGVSAFLCGGAWVNGAHGGGRAVDLSSYPWGVSATIGSRQAGDKLAG